MTTADSVLVFTFLIAAVVTSGFSFYLRQPLMWLIAAVMWILCSINGLRLTTAPWDAMAFLFWMSLGLMIACVLMAIDMRRKRKEEEKEGEEKGRDPDDADDYLEQSSDYKDKQNRVSEATGGRRVRRRRY